MGTAKEHRYVINTGRAVYCFPPRSLLQFHGLHNISVCMEAQSGVGFWLQSKKLYHAISAMLGITHL